MLLSLDIKCMEQGLMRYAHRPDGNMPWQILPYEYNINQANVDDIWWGVRSAHGHFYHKDHPLHPLWLAKQRANQEFWRPTQSTWF